MLYSQLEGYRCPERTLSRSETRSRAWPYGPDCHGELARWPGLGRETPRNPQSGQPKGLARRTRAGRAARETRRPDTHGALARRAQSRRAARATPRPDNQALAGPD
jgi:hypothetical protein